MEISFRRSSTLFGWCIWRSAAGGSNGGWSAAGGTGVCSDDGGGVQYVGNLYDLLWPVTVLIIPYDSYVLM